MSLPAGSRLGSYEIVAPIGAGGMGEVYRAMDPKLDRHVAIKVLPPHLGSSADALERFEREARAVAALSHPNILSIFEFGREGSMAFAVMELLDGETLRQKLTTPIPIRKAIDYGVQIARGLAAAHARGIVHRDLKPENVFVTSDGRVKILDFGLARQTPAFAGSGATTSPTIDRHTDPGTVLGTVGYMSPEQARGEPADERSDLFSLGALLYELVSGRRAFQRDTSPETLTAILREDPPPVSSPSSAAVPPLLARVVEHCLEKNPVERFQSASDVAFALENLSGSGASKAEALAAPSRRRALLPWSVAALFALIAAALAVVAFRAPAGTEPELTRLSMRMPANLSIATSGAPSRWLTLSPDGRTLVYVSSESPGRRQLYRRPLDRTAVEPIAGTEGAFQPFFSPDGQWIAFFTNAGELKRVSRDGGPAVTLVKGLSNPQWGFGVWRPDEVIVFSTMETLQQIPAGGGAATALTTVDVKAGESFHHFPMLVPETGDIMFVTYDNDANRQLELYRWDSRERIKLLEGIKSPLFVAPNHILYTQDETLMAAPYDARRRTAGPSTPLPESVVLDNWRFGVAQMTVASNGTLAYIPTDPQAPVPSVGWVSRTGTFEEIGPLPRGLEDLSMSPDGKTFAIVAGGRLSLYDVARRVTSPISIPKRTIETVTWHPDGRRLTLGGAYLSLFDLETEQDMRLTESGRPKRFATWSKDGRTVAYMTFNPGNDIHVLSLDGGAKPRPLVATDSIEADPSISPDGRLMALRATAVGGTTSGRRDIYIVRFPEGTGKVQVTSNGGSFPFWSRDSRELYFVGPPAPGTLYAATISVGDRIQVGDPRPLFPTNDVALRAVSPDGTRFLGLRVPRADPLTEVVVVQNWTRELARLVPPMK
jgi:eukaryotic-like serine/threonine-protein kinase